MLAIVTRFLSALVGWFFRLRLPIPIAQVAVRSFAHLVGADVESAAENISAYHSISDFFIRDLKPGLRPIGSGIISPVDGVLRSICRIHQGNLEPIKGQQYTAISLLQDPVWGAKFIDGFALNFYLSPKDYHHVHAPFSGEIVRSTYIPGPLWPVNSWGLKNIKNLLARNERLVTYMQTELGLIAVVMVGAMNVGRITVEYDDWLTNYSRTLPQVSSRDYLPTKSMQKGNRLGTFHFGSSVVLLIANANLQLQQAWVEKQVVFGQSLS